MAEHDMRHMEFLQAVADETVRVLREKEKTYQGSWKRRGGVGAFMMLARKWDRIESMLQVWHPANPGATAQPPAPYDVFTHIARDPSGDDGTVLAEVRDLCGYLVHVQAEMMARGVVPAPPSIRSEARAARIEADFYELRAQEWAVQPDTARSMIENALLRVSDRVAGQPGTPEDGGHHADRELQSPWVVRRQDLASGAALRVACYEDCGSHFWKLKPALTEAEHYGVQMAREQPPGLANLVLPLYEKAAPGVYVLNVRKAPGGRRSLWPRLRHELNAKEHGDSMAWLRPLYVWIEAETKWRIADGWRAWCE